MKPEIKEFNNITSVENEGATFECRAIGDPLPELSIRKQGQDRSFSEEVLSFCITYLFATESIWYLDLVSLVSVSSLVF